MNFIIDFFTNLIYNQNRYRTNSEAVIVSCFFNPQNSPYRLIAFQKYYNSIKHLPHRIIECVIGDAKPQLPDSPYITRVQSDSLLWHKETLLNKVISELPEQFKYVFWLDADVKFTNLDWLIDSVNEMKRGAKIVQPFEYCIHLDKNQTEPSFNVEGVREFCGTEHRHKKMWRSFCANCKNAKHLAVSKNYDAHGHVGFAWGATRELLTEVPLYDKGLIGGADHIIAHAAAGHIPHNCITKSFGDDIQAVEAWMHMFYQAAQGRIGYAKGDLYHYWHGDIEKRQYLKRIQDFTPQAKTIDEKDKNGLYVKQNNPYMKNYFKNREVAPNIEYDEEFEDFAMGFAEDMGYVLADFIATANDSQYFNEPEQAEAEFKIGPVTDPFPYQGAGSEAVENYPDNESNIEGQYKDPNDPMVNEPEIVIEYQGAGSDTEESYPDTDSENFS